MKLRLHLICLLVPVFSLGINATNPPTYKQQLVSAINQGDYPQATNILSFVEDWSYDISKEGMNINSDSCWQLLQYIIVHDNCRQCIDSLSQFMLKVNEEYGLYYYNKGEYESALPFWERVVKIDRSNVKDKFHYAKSLNNLGKLYWKNGNYDKAESSYLEALEIKKSSVGENHPSYAVSYYNMGRLYKDQRDYLQAEYYYLKAAQIWQTQLGENHPHYASAMNSLGELYNETGDYKKAELCYEKALNIRKNILGINHPSYAVTLCNIGTLYAKTGDYEQAKSFLLQSMLIYKKLFLQSVDFMSERQRKFFWSAINKNFNITYPLFTYSCYKHNVEISTFAYDNELFMKGLLLSSSELIRRSIVESSDTLIINQWKELMQIRKRLTFIEEKNNRPDNLDSIRLEAEYLEKEITRLSATYRQSQLIWQISWDSVRTHLEQEQVAIEYMLAPLKEDSIMYCALLLRKDSKYPEMIPLFEEKEVQTLISTSTENQIYNYNAEGQQISAFIWDKVLSRIKPGETIYFAPSGLLYQLAIEALPYDSIHTMGDVYNLIRLSSTREIVTRKEELNHSMATLYGGITYTTDIESLLAESESYSAKNLLASRGIESDTLNRGSVNYLAGTKVEVENINRMLTQNNLQVQLYTATNANEESFKSLSGQHQNILHVATHGFFWSDSTAQKKDFFAERMMRMGDDAPAKKVIDPLNRCGLLFAGANLALQGHSNELPEGVQDGILTAKEISLLDLRDADLVVLSACETGKGEITGDGVFGLQRAFKQAGAQTIIMSLWPVNDAATQMLMTEFYRNWITTHQSKREAFRNAQNAVRSQYQEPVYWAGFIMLD